MTRISTIVCLILVAYGCLFPVFAEAGKRAEWPTCLGSICYSSDLPDAQQVTKQFGGTLHRKGQDDQAVCLTDGKYFLRLDVHYDIPAYISSAYLSREKICSKGIRAKASLAKLKTDQGLAIGQSLRSVIEMYGPPNVVQYEDQTTPWQSEFDEKRWNLIKASSVLIYGPKSADTLFQASVHIDSGSVSGIELSNSE